MHYSLIGTIKWKLKKEVQRHDNLQYKNEIMVIKVDNDILKQDKIVLSKKLANLPEEGSYKESQQLRREDIRLSERNAV